MSKPFKFKQFTVHQDRCAMKIGTDGVLLGAWADISHDPLTVLDIGSGTGIIALQLAQRSRADMIDAVELDPEAYEQCVENFENSPWNDRLFCYHASLEEFAEEIDDQYDLIISNPPFYEGSFRTDNESRNNARSTSSLSFESLLQAVEKLLDRSGKANFIIPFENESAFLDLASKYGLHPEKICRVKGNPSTEIKRSLLSLSKESKGISESELIIETARHDYTTEYLELVHDFYLKM